MQRNYHRVGRDAGSRNERKELGCRNCVHCEIFDLEAALNKAKRGSRNDCFPVVALLER